MPLQESAALVEGTNSVAIRQAAEPSDIAAVKACLRVYTAWLNEDISFQNYAAEFEGLPGKYVPPSGALLVAVDSATDAVLGCIAMRPIEPQPEFLLGREADVRYCEVKRLFVYPEARGRQVARALVREVVGRAAKQGYGEILLDTLARMQPAIKLYTSEGFERTSQYYDTPLRGTVYFSKKLI
jgi:ribosomal protein S18 acetylase RimI-like enzyme